MPEGNQKCNWISNSITSTMHIMAKLPKRSAIALAVLATLLEGPMHPYRMQRLIKERGKDQVINVAQRAGLYQTIRRLQRDGLISRQQVTRADNRPERTIYDITASGRATALEWMRQVLSQPAREFAEFPSGLAFLTLLTPPDALRQLELRTHVIEREIGRIDTALREALRGPGLLQSEMEYVRATHIAQLSWVRSVVEELRSGRLRWNCCATVAKIEDFE